ncbi:unnamed protein product [Calypogeia fissa]
MFSQAGVLQTLLQDPTDGCSSRSFGGESGEGAEVQPDLAIAFEGSRERGEKAAVVTLQPALNVCESQSQPRIGAVQVL